MWPDRDRRAAEIAEKAKIFDTGSYLGTANLLEDLANEVKVNTSVQILGTLVDQVEATWRLEYVKDDSLRDKRLTTIWTILATATKSLSPEEIVRLQLVITDLTRNAQIMTPIGDAFMPFPPGKVRFVGMCLEYLMNAEGVFDQAIRYLFGLFSLTKGYRFLLTS